MKTLRVKAVVANWRRVSAFLGDAMRAAGQPMAQIHPATIAAEEIFVNICRYAYRPRGGMVTVGIEATADIRMRFEDEGLPFNPLNHQPPDMTGPDCSREVGGMGILMVKRLMDAVLYRYEDGKNMLEMVKRAGEGEPAGGQQDPRA